MGFFSSSLEEDQKTLCTVLVYIYVIQVNWTQFRKEINMFRNIVVRGKFQCMVDPRNISLPPRLFRSYYSEYRSSKFRSWIRLVDYFGSTETFFVSCKQRKKYVTRILNFFKVDTITYSLFFCILKMLIMKPLDNIKSWSLIWDFPKSGRLNVFHYYLNAFNSIYVHHKFLWEGIVVLREKFD